MAKSSPLKPEFIEEIKKRLLASKKELAEDIERLAAEDPLMNPKRVAESVPEFEEASSQMQGSERIAEEKEVLEKHLEETEEALKKIEEGSYGICKNCENPIDQARLDANPQALYCLDCEKDLPAEQEGA